jgi:hypothetical protein
MRIAGPGRPKGSGKENGYKLSKMNQVETEDFIKRSMKKVFNEHLSYNEYIEWCREQEISLKQGNEYWIRVWGLVKEKFRLEKDQLITKHLQKYWDIHDRAMNLGDLSNARQVLNDISKLMGMNEPDKVDVKTELKIKFNFGGTEEEE